MTTVRNLSKIKGLSEAKIEKIKESANKLLPSGFITGIELEAKVAHLPQSVELFVCSCTGNTAKERRSHLHRFQGI